MENSTRISALRAAAAMFAGAVGLAPAASAGEERPPDAIVTPVNIGVREEDRAAIAAILEQRLLDEYALYTETWNDHWNVSGIEFEQLHELFGEQYKGLAELIDPLAERIQALGFKPFLSGEGYSEDARATSTSERTVGALKMIARLAAEHERIARTLRADAAAIRTAYGDAATENLLLDTVLAHEKMAWMLRAHLADLGGSEG
jgi:starvation-inducible DNA-binding protein